MTTDAWLAQSTTSLRDAGIATARLDCLILLEDATAKNRAWLLAHPEHTIPSHQLHALGQQLAKRISHQPLAYIRGITEFYGRTFAVNSSVLVPRPETETMIDIAKSLPAEHRRTVIDVGTGSGAIAITIALELPTATVLATDTDPSCLAVARANRRRHNANVQIMQGNLIDPVPPSALNTAVLLCNLPYVPDDHEINQAAMNEPKLAIFGGADGLEYYRQLFAQIGGLKYQPSFVITESLPAQHTALEDIAKHYRYTQVRQEDFMQLFAANT